MREEGFTKKKLIFWGSIGGFILLVILSLATLIAGIVTIEVGYVGIEKKLGKVTGVILGEGTHIVMPYYTTIEPMDARIQKVSEISRSSSSDMQAVTTEVVLNFNIDSKNAPKIYQKSGTIERFKNYIIDPAIHEAIKDATAKFNAEELITQRTKVKELIYKTLKDKLIKSHIVVQEVSIKDFKFSELFDKAIEDKQIAEQEAKKEINILQKTEAIARQTEATARGAKNAKISKAEGDAQATILNAKAEAEAVVVAAEAQKKADILNAEAKAKSQNLINGSITEKILRLRYIERWDGVLPRVSTGGKSQFLMSIDSKK